MNVIIHGEDKRLRVLARRLESADRNVSARLARYAEIHLCPIPTRTLPEVLTPTGREGRLLIGYGLPTECARVAERYLDLECDEIFLEENARLTALGTVGHLLMHNDRALCDLAIGVIGYGRIGRRLVRYLSYLGAHVTVYSSRAVVLPRAAHLVQVDWSTPADASIYARLDVLINTAPTPFLIGQIPCEVVDLASGAYVPEQIAHTKLPSLPARLYHESAGFACYRAVVRNLVNTR